MKKPSSLPLVGASMGIGIEPLRDFLRLKLGRIVLIQLPGDRELALQVMRFCRENRIYVMLAEVVHRHNHERWHAAGLSKADLEEAAAEAGAYFVGRYAVGEAGGMLYWPKSYVIDEGVHAYPSLPPCRNEKEAHDAYIAYLEGQLAFERGEICDCPLFDVESSIAFACHAEAGIDGLCLEMLPGDPRLTLAAIRGTARSRGMLWGVHIAMLWYGGFALDELWLRRWRISLYLAYLSGADFIYPESGHLEYAAPGAQKFAFDSPEMLRTRRELRRLHQLSQVHARPAAGPLAPAAVLLGNCDGHPGIWNPYAWGQYENGEAWETSDAERGWELFDTVFRREDIFHETVKGDRDHSGNPPCGQIDVVPPEADLSRYKLLLLIGYNRMDDVLYEKLAAYAENGGHLVLWLSHFDTAENRGDPVKLYRNGDLSRLCGLRVTGRDREDVTGMKFIRESSFPEYDFPVRPVGRDPYCLGHSVPAAVEITDPGLRILAVYSGDHGDTMENALKHPLLTERRLGKGAVFTVTSFSPPGASGMRKFAEILLRTALAAHLTELEVISPDTVRWAAYPDGDGRQVLYVLNCDPDLPQSIRVQYRGRLSQTVPLEPAGFRILYAASGILLIPSDPLFELHGADGRWQADTAAQNLDLENLSSGPRTCSVNGVEAALAPGERKTIACPARIPGEKAPFLDPGFLEEPVIEMKDPSTPY
ncbi:MAG: beta-galactosidase trimerization domain-containing protein [Lentisphaeria bacterium]|nr:beta-galactosidase trimerization domain-containing protein [Lentisphaeria bacterium]